MNPPNEALPLAGEDLAVDRTPRIPGDLHKTITMAQIARAAGVSQGAISSLLNDRDYGIRVSEKTRERVFKVCREMGYIPNDLRAVVRMYPELGDFCLLISSKFGGLTDPFVARVANATMQAVSGTARSLTLALYDEDADYLQDVEKLPHPVRSGVASKVLYIGEPNKSLIHTVLKRGLPVACVGCELTEPGAVTFLPDYQQASQIALGHLFQLGHREIGIVSGPFGAVSAHVNELNRGVRLACEAVGLQVGAQSIIYGDLSFAAGQAAFATFIERKPRPTAIFCMSDEAAAGIMAAAHAKGCDIPGDLSVIGCSDEPATRFAAPPLTTVHLPIEEMVQAAVAEIDRLVRQGATGDGQRIVLPVRLVERESCAAPASKPCEPA
ncbi:MAG TPA: LacI family DNA-binding transcriptional regulator [Chthoniobacteraceae bacterium]